MVTRPGKYSDFERVRQQGAEWVGLPADWQDQLSESEALGVPLPSPFKRGGKQELIFPGLPVTELNLATKDPSQLGQLLTSMVHPGAKAILEFGFNYSVYFREQRERPGSRFTDAPGPLIDTLPKPAQDYFVKKNVIAQDNQGNWQWRKDAQFLADLTPLTSVLTAAVGQAGQQPRGQAYKTPRGSTTTERVIGYGTGLRPKTYDPQRTRLGRVWDELTEVQDQVKDMEELGVNKDKQGRYTRQFARLKTRENRLAFERSRLQAKTGDEVTDTPTKAPKVYPPGYDPEHPTTAPAPPGGGGWWWEKPTVRPAQPGAPAEPVPSGGKKSWWWE